MEQVATVGRMIDDGALIRAHCDTCRNAFKVDLAAIAAVKGRDYCLIDRRGACRLYDCSGTVMFSWSPGTNAPYRAMTTDAGIRARMARGHPGQS